jgi:hypothetical protein
MSKHKIPIFFKRRFIEGVFENILFKSMKYWIGFSKRNYREFEINVFNEALDEYFSSIYDVNVYEEVDITDLYKFQDYLSEKYEKVLREFWEENR